MPTWAFLLVCAIVPGVWAIAVARVLRAREAKERRFDPKEKPPSDYSI